MLKVGAEELRLLTAAAFPIQPIQFTEKLIPQLVDPV
jgi:hypothetical protein